MLQYKPTAMRESSWYDKYGGLQRELRNIGDMGCGKARVPVEIRPGRVSQASLAVLGTRRIYTSCDLGDFSMPPSRMMGSKDPHGLPFRGNVEDFIVSIEDA